MAEHGSDGKKALSVSFPWRLIGIRLIVDDFIAKKRKHHGVFAQQGLHAQLQLSCIQRENILLETKDSHICFYVGNVRAGCTTFFTASREKEDRESKKEERRADTISRNV